LAFDAVTNELHLACAGGRLITFYGPGAKPAPRVLQIGRDLRDVMVRPGGLLLTQFRSPALIWLDANGEILRRQTPPLFKSEHLKPVSNQHEQALFAPTVAWRTRLLPDGRAVMLHQRARMGEVGIHPDPNQPEEVPSSSYGGSVGAEFECRPPIVHAAVTVFDADGQPSSEDFPLTSFGGLHGAVLPVDLALSTRGKSIAIAAAGSRTVKIIGQHTVSTRDASHSCQPLGTDVQIPGQPISVAFTADDDVLVQTRAPAALWRIRQPGAQVEMLFRFSGEDLRNSGHELFHNRASEHSDIACASCHPGGRDDGHTWKFSELGLRRTQSLVGGLLATLPFHWDGDMEDVNQIMDEVFIERMGGDQPHPARRAQLALWLDGLQPLARWMALDRDAVKRGQSLFNDPVVACASCHSGARYTNNKTVDVGTGLALQVPGLLGVGSRAPYMHDGCAPDLAARFVVGCGGGDAHGKTSHLSATQIDDLVAYLETL
jgi:mono/diheme cytochrome c family protein